MDCYTLEKRPPLCSGKAPFTVRGESLSLLGENGFRIEPVYARLLMENASGRKNCCILHNQFRRPPERIIIN